MLWRKGALRKRARRAQAVDSEDMSTLAPSPLCSLPRLRSSWQTNHLKFSTSTPRDLRQFLKDLRQQQVQLHDQSAGPFRQAGRDARGEAFVEVVLNRLHGVPSAMVQKLPKIVMPKVE